jgi:hypothetical protein
VPSLLRGFSAPVKLVVEGQSDDHLRLMFAHDSDAFNRWEAGQRLYMKLVLALYEAAAAGAPATPLEERCAAGGGVPADMVAAYKSVLTDAKLDGAFKVSVLHARVCVCARLCARAGGLARCPVEVTPGVGACHEHGTLHSRALCVRDARTGRRPRSPIIRAPTQAMALRLPSMSEIVDRIDEADPVLVWQVSRRAGPRARCRP